MNLQIFQGHTPPLSPADAHVVIDVIRAFTTCQIALTRGVKTILLAGEISEAHALKRRFPDYLLAGERNAIKIEGFDLGNSPWEMAHADIAGRGLILTTSNGVRATLHALKHDGHVLVAGFSSAAATVAAIQSMAATHINLIASHPTGDEDLACAEWMAAQLSGQYSITETQTIARIRNAESARKFLDPNRPEFDARDIDLCARPEPAAVAMQVILREDGIPAITAIHPTRQ